HAHARRAPDRGAARRGRALRAAHRARARGRRAGARGARRARGQTPAAAGCGTRAGPGMISGPMAAPRPLHRMSTVDALADALRREILDGALPAGAWLRERELTESYGVARHSLRAALRALAAEGLVTIEPHRGAHVAELTADDVRALYELRAALELEAAHLALERNDGRLPLPVHAALDALQKACAGEQWSEINEAHGALHTAIVRAAHSP